MPESLAEQNCVVSIEAVVIRADGTVEDLGVIASSEQPEDED
jgi:hypothetical protein